MPSITRISLLLLSLIFLSYSTYSQEIPAPNPCGMCRDGVHSNNPPYQIDINSEKPYLYTAAILLATGFIIQASNNEKILTLDEINNLDKNNLWAIDKSTVTKNSSKASRYSDYIRTSITLLPIFFLSNHHTKEDIGPLVTMSFEVLATTYGLTNIAKNIAKRPRPYAYNPDVSLSKKFEINTKRSFFSGHTSHTAAFTFFIAKVVSDYHPNAKKAFLPIIWSGAILIPAVTGYLRIQAGKHFPTDVIAGYVTGALVGFLIPYLHTKEKTNISITPLLGGQSKGILLNIPLGRG